MTVVTVTKRKSKLEKTFLISVFPGVWNNITVVALMQ